MSIEPLPERPDLEQLRTQGKDLRRAVAAGDELALAHAAEHHHGVTAASFTLSQAQLVIARHYGAPSWRMLRERVAAAARFGRSPDETPPSSDAADEFLRLACLGFGQSDGRDRWESAATLLARDPTLSARSIHAAAATGDVDAVRSFLAAQPSAAGAAGGPFDWPPLLYVTYARTANVEATTVTRLLLDAGADPNAGYLWHGTYPFTALTGVFGEGEQGPERQPRHSSEFELATLLLDAGADPNDSQALYNRMFRPADDHLELLFRYGLGRGDGGPWRRRRPDVVAAPAELLRSQLHWAITHGMEARVRLLLANGVDAVTPFDDGVGAAETAARHGYPQLAELLVDAGCPAPQLPADEAAVLAALDDRSASIRHLIDEHDGFRRLRAERPGWIVWMAARGHTSGVRVLQMLGFDVNALGRGDTPVEEPWETGLHRAAGNGDRAMVELLLELGADPNIRDARFDATPLDWARHEGHDDVAVLLERVTRD